MASAKTDQVTSADRISCAKRVSQFHSGPCLWDEYQTLAKQYSPCNLGSGFPNLPLDDKLKSELLSAAEIPDTCWYPRAQGRPELCSEISQMYSPRLGRKIEAMSEVVVTVGAYQGIYWFLESYTQEGDEVIVFDPAFDAYITECTKSGAKLVPVSLNISPDNRWEIDREALTSSFNSHTKVIVLNSPHNPTSKMEFIAELCEKYNCLVLSDEVYERTVLPGSQHISIASFPGMWERTVTLCSGGKLFGVTGWRVGWAIGPKPFIDKMYSVCKCDTFGTAAILQVALAGMMREERLHPTTSFLSRISAMYADNLRKLHSAFTEAGMPVLKVEGGMFLVVDCTKRAFSFQNTAQFLESRDHFDVKMSKFIIQHFKLQLLPLSAFYHPAAKVKSHDYLRVCFAKSRDTVDKAVQIINTFK